MNIANLIRREPQVSAYPSDVLQEKPCANVARPSDVLSSGSSPEAALQLMLQEETDVLPVYDADQFNGFVFKNDLIAFVASQKQKLEETVLDYMEELRDIREQLATSRQMLDTVFDSTQATIFLVSAECTLVFFNRKANERSRVMYGRELRAGDTVIDFIPGGTSSEVYRIFKSHFDAALAGEYVTHERKVDYSGVSFWFRAEYHPFYEGKVIVGVAVTITDISDQKKHELQVQRQNELLKEIAWMQSHQTRQPVATILGLINILDKTELGDKNLEIIRLLEQTTQRLDDVIRDTVVKANSF